MSNNNDIREILERLQNLQIQQAELVERVINITDGSNQTERNTHASERVFRVGDRVRVKNPTPSQFRYGTVTRIGISQITVESPTGKTLTRLPKNLILDRSTPTVIVGRPR